jgi:hypothetical protein
MMIQPWKRGPAGAFIFNAVGATLSSLLTVTAAGPGRAVACRVTPQHQRAPVVNPASYFPATAL